MVVTGHVLEGAFRGVLMRGQRSSHLHEVTCDDTTSSFFQSSSGLSFLQL